MIFSFVACGDTPAPTYTVTYVDGINDAEITVPSDTNQYHAGDTVTVKFTGIGNRTNYTFSGWSDGTTTYTSSGTTSFAMGTANVTLTAQWQWNYSYIGTKASSEAKEVGDIVFNDGSAMPYTTFTTLDTATKNEKKTSAIAIIFYKGTGLNSGDDTTTTRTLGVGLKHNSNISWCTNSANANNVDITTILCSHITPIPGEPTTITGDKNGSNNLEQIAAFLTAAENTTDDTTGEGAANRYPAFYFAKNYKNQIIGSETASRILADSEFATGWYLPSIAELYQIYVNGRGEFNIDSVSYNLGGNQFGSSIYWSSSDSSYSNSNSPDIDYAYEYHSTSAGSPAWLPKTDPARVCAIREFN